MSDAKPSFIKKWGILGVLSLALAIIIIDTTLLNVSLGTIIRELHTNIQALQWVITLYALILAAFTITGGRLGDLFGRKRMFMTGAIIFAIGSFTASISHSVGVLLLGEAIIEGIGAVMMMPATASLLVANYKGRDRAIAFGVWGSIAAAAAALGPILGGFLTTHYSWRWGFRINVFVTILLLIGSVLLKESIDTKEKHKLDIFGVVLSGLGLLGIVFGVIESSTYGWVHAKTLFTIGSRILDLGNISIVLPAIILGFLFLLFFILWEIGVEEHGDTPLVSMNVFKNKQFSSGLLTTGILSLGQSGIFFTFPIFFQAVRGLNAFQTGLALLPMPIAIFVGSGLSTILGKKLAPKNLIQVGFVFDLISIIVLRMTLSPTVTAWQMAPGLFIFGLGMGFIMPQISNLTLSALDVNQAGEASGITNTFRQVGFSLGSALIGAVLLSQLGTNLASGVQASTIIPTQLKPALSQSISKQSSSVEFGGATFNNPLPQVVTDEITRIAHQATTDANKTSMGYAYLFLLAGLATTFMLPNKKLVHHEAPAKAAPAGH